MGLGLDGGLDMLRVGWVGGGVPPPLVFSKKESPRLTNTPTHTHLWTGHPPVQVKRQREAGRHAGNCIHPQCFKAQKGDQ